jgi:hypothetical protein
MTVLYHVEEVVCHRELIGHGRRHCKLAPSSVSQLEAPRPTSSGNSLT